MRKLADEFTLCMNKLNYVGTGSTRIFTRSSFNAMCTLVVNDIKLNVIFLYILLLGSANDTICAALNGRLSKL